MRQATTDDPRRHRFHAGQMLSALLSLWVGCAPLSPAPTPGGPDPAVPDEPCRVVRHPVALDAETELGSVPRLLSYLEGHHSDVLIWNANNNKTAIAIDAWNPRAYRVESTPVESYVARTLDRTCVNRLEIVVQVALNTGDGRLVEETAELTLRGYGDIEAFGTMDIAWDGFGGSYADRVIRGYCLQRVQVKLLLGESGFSGSLNDQLSAGACDVTSGAVSSRQLSGHWGVRWQSY